MKLSTLKSVREAPSPEGEGLRQVYVYEYLPQSTGFPIEKWVVGDFPAAPARRAYEAVMAFLGEHFADPQERGTPALTERDAAQLRAAARRATESDAGAEEGQEA